MVTHNSKSDLPLRKKSVYLAGLDVDRFSFTSTSTFGDGVILLAKEEAGVYSLVGDEVDPVPKMFFVRVKSLLYFMSR